MIFRRGRFRELVDRQLDLFEADTDLLDEAHDVVLNRLAVRIEARTRSGTTFFLMAASVRGDPDSGA